MNSEQRESITDEYTASDMAILCNVRVLREGVDIPEVDGIVFAEKCSSTIDIVQSVGRALRKSYKGKISSVLVPCFIPENFNEYEEQDYDNLLMVLRGMATTDERIIAHIKSLGDGSKEIAYPDLVNLGTKIEGVAPKPTKINVDELRALIMPVVQNQLNRLVPFLSYPDFEAKVHSFPEVDSKRKYKVWQKDHPDCPSNPYKTYKGKGWVNWPYLFGKFQKRK